MRRRIVCGMLVAVVAIVIAISETWVSAQVSSDNLLEQRVSIHIENSTFRHALSELNGVYGVPIGFELGLGQKAQYHLNIDLKNVTLEDALNEIVGQESAYRWELRDGVINIIPIRSRDTFVEKLLNTPIRRFDQPKKLGKFQIRDAIVELPEVRAFLKAHGVTASDYGYFYNYSSQIEKVDLTVSGTDLRGVLNKVIKETEHNMWMISRGGKNLNSLYLSF